MRLVPTTTLHEGMLLAQDVVTGRPDGIPLLRAGVPISADYRARLERAGIGAVYVDDDLGEGIAAETLITLETRRAVTEAVAHAFRVSGGIGEPPHLPRHAMRVLQDAVERIVADVSRVEGTGYSLADLATADAYTFQHPIDVAALGVLIGQAMFRERGWIDYRGVRQFHRLEERVHKLGLGLLLHDVGKLALPHQLVDKAEALSAEEKALLRSHRRLGLELVRGYDPSSLVKAIILRHHERWDGSGYPEGKQGAETHEMARIAAVADVFDAITSERPGRPALPAHEGVRTIMAQAGTLFDPDVVDFFVRLVAPFPTGHEVRLTDGRRAVVVSVPAQALDRPALRVIDGPDAPYDVSLLAEPSLQIEGWASTWQAAA